MTVGPGRRVAKFTRAFPRRIFEWRARAHVECINALARHSKSEWAIRNNDDAPKDAIGQLPSPLPVALCDDTMKIVITRTGATIIAAFTIAICNRLGTVWDYSTNHLVTFNYQPARRGLRVRWLNFAHSTVGLQKRKRRSKPHAYVY